MTNLSELAARIEAAEGPDRLLDANIHWRVRRDAFEADSDHTEQTYCYARHGWTMNRADHAFLNSVPVPRYTSSVDAALKLVPEGAWWGVYKSDLSGTFVAEVEPPDCEECGARAATPALALCAAALRAKEVSDHG